MRKQRLRILSTSFTSTDTICGYPTAFNPIRFGPQLTPKKPHTITHSPENNTCQMVTHSGTYAPNCCCNCCVTGILLLNYWDRIKVQVQTLTSTLYPNATLSMPLLSN